MLALQLSTVEFFDEAKEKFVTLEATTVELEHSLVSLSKWEEIWEKPFLSSDHKTDEEMISYINCMSLSGPLPEVVTDRFTEEHSAQINEYLARKMTATWFNEPKGPPSKEVITAEIIYYWMIALNIPKEFETVHLNKLFALIKVVNLKNQPEKKTRNTKESLANRRALNEARRAQMGTTG